jgi:hypothetical protein
VRDEAAALRDSERSEREQREQQRSRKREKEAEERVQEVQRAAEARLKMEAALHMEQLELAVRLARECETMAAQCSELECKLATQATEVSRLRSRATAEGIAAAKEARQQELQARDGAGGSTRLRQTRESVLEAQLKERDARLDELTLEVLRLKGELDAATPRGRGERTASPVHGAAEEAPVCVRPLKQPGTDRYPAAVLEQLRRVVADGKLALHNVAAVSALFFTLHTGQVCCIQV